MAFERPLAAPRYVLGPSRSAATPRVLRPGAASPSDRSRCHRTSNSGHSDGRLEGVVGRPRGAVGVDKTRVPAGGRDRLPLVVVDAADPVVLLRHREQVLLVVVRRGCRLVLELPVAAP